MWRVKSVEIISFSLWYEYQKLHLSETQYLGWVNFSLWIRRGRFENKKCVRRYLWVNLKFFGDWVKKKSCRKKKVNWKIGWKVVESSIWGETKLIGEMPNDESENGARRIEDIGHKILKFRLEKSEILQFYEKCWL